MSSINAVNSEYANHYLRPTTKRGLQGVLEDHIATVLKQVGIAVDDISKLSFDIDANGTVKVASALPNNDEITAALNGDMGTKSLLRMLNPAAVREPTEAEKQSFLTANTIQESEVIDLSQKQPYVGGDPILDKMYDQMFLRMTKSLTKAVGGVDERGWRNFFIEQPDGQWVEHIEDNVFWAMDFDSAEERENLYDYVLNKFQNAGLHPATARQTTLQVQYFQGNYQIGVNPVAHPADSLSDDQRQKIIAALSGDRYLLEKLQTAQGKFQQQFGMGIPTLGPAGMKKGPPSSDSAASFRFADSANATPSAIGRRAVYA